jgi:hypothetical protein
MRAKKSAAKENCKLQLKKMPARVQQDWNCNTINQQWLKGVASMFDRKRQPQSSVEKNTIVSRRQERSIFLCSTKETVSESKKLIETYEIEQEG